MTILEIALTVLVVILCILQWCLWSTVAFHREYIAALKHYVSTLKSVNASQDELLNNYRHVVDEEN